MNAREFLIEKGILSIKDKIDVNTVQRWLDEYAEQFRYDYSKNCKCKSRIGETWCCNQCGLPTKRFKK
jgi:hypothetical protein